MLEKRKTPEIIVKGGEPAAVIIDLADYRQMLERLGDTEGLKMLDRLDKSPETE